MGVLNRAQKRFLYDCGFIAKEIRAYDNAQTPSGKPQPFKLVWNSEPFQKMIRSRRQAMKRARKAGFSDDQFRRAILRRYRMDKKLNPFDFIKDAYRVVLRKRTRRTYVREAIKKRTQSIKKIGFGYGVRYR
jgi:hypothetical protein